MSAALVAPAALLSFSASEQAPLVDALLSHLEANGFSFWTTPSGKLWIGEHWDHSTPEAQQLCDRLRFWINENSANRAAFVAHLRKRGLVVPDGGTVRETSA